MKPAERLREAIVGADGPAIVAFLTAGFPHREGFAEVLRKVAEAADAVELGVPFSDPMADGVTIQRSSRTAIENGVTLKWILELLEAEKGTLAAPVLLFSYLNPLLVYGFAALAERAAQVGVAGFIVPDLPYEESAPFRAALAPHGLALVQLVTPATPAARLKMLCEASDGFVYAVTRTGITGGDQALPPALAGYLEQVRAASALPVCAGFGVREAAQVQLIGRHAEGVIVGSALVEVLERGDDPAAFLRTLRSP
jgi:tryptophan synthase alpha chain